MNWDWDKWQEKRERSATPQDIWERIKGNRNRFPGGLIVLILVCLFLAYSCIFTVGVDEVGVIQRFGKYVRTVQPGLSFKLPFGIERVTKVKVRHIYKEEFGFRTLRAGIKTRYATSGIYKTESLMLTGDLNVAIVPWVVQYRINNPYNFLFKVRNVRDTLRDLSEASMRMVVGDRSINEVLTKREEIAFKAEKILQKKLDEVQTGIKVVNIELKKTNVPEPVQPSFNEVNQAIQEREKLIYQARERYNKEIPAAKGKAEKIIKEAEGYAIAKVNKARGDVARFLDLYEEYVKAKDITLRRLYLEAMGKMLPRVGKKYIIDKEQKNLLHLLDLTERKVKGKVKGKGKSKGK